MRYGICHLNYIKKKQKNKKQYKCDVLIKMVRAKLTGNWEGGGMGEKNIQTNNFLIRGPIPTSIPMGNRVSLASTPVGNRASTLNH